MEGDAYAISRKPAVLVEIAEAIQEGIRPRIATAGRIRDLRDSDRLARLEPVAQAAVESVAPIGAREPLLR